MHLVILHSACPLQSFPCRIAFCAEPSLTFFVAAAGAGEVCVGLHAGLGADDGQLLRAQGLPGAAGVHDGEGAPVLQHRCAFLRLSRIMDS